MSTQAVAFNARYSPELIDQAVHAFRDYRLKRYGAIYFGACVINAIGAALVVSWGTKSYLMLAAAAFFGAMGPIGFLYHYFLEPSRQANRMKASLPTNLRISLDAATLWISNEGREIAFPWSRFKAVHETASLFLLVLSPHTFLFIPTTELPVEACEMLHGKSQLGSASSGKSSWPRSSS